MTGDKRGTKSNKGTKGGVKRPKRQASHPNSVRHDLHPFGMGYDQSRLDEGGYGGVFRAFRVHSLHPQRKG